MGMGVAGAERAFRAAGLNRQLNNSVFFSLLFFFFGLPVGRRSERASDHELSVSAQCCYYDESTMSMCIPLPT